MNKRYECVSRCYCTINMKPTERDIYLLLMPTELEINCVCPSGLRRGSSVLPVNMVSFDVLYVSFTV